MGRIEMRTWKIVVTIVTVVVIVIVASSSYISLSQPSDGVHFLKMTISLSSPTIKEGETLTINFELYNPFPIPLTIPPGTHYPKIQGFLILANSLPCEYGSPYGYAVAEGYYGMNNYSEAQPVLLFKPVIEIYNCLVITPINSLHGYELYPLSDVITIIGPGRTLNDQSSALVNGTWFVNGSDIENWSTISRIPLGNNASGATFEYFSPGVYTVIAGDEWGDIQITHFTVLSRT